MEIVVSQFGDAAKKVALVGKLDIDGAAAIESRLADLARAKGNIVIDMSKVAFIASIGLRHLVMTAKAVARNAGKMLLLDPNPLVTEVLQVSGLQGILPIVPTDKWRDPVARSGGCVYKKESNPANLPGAPRHRGSADQACWFPSGKEGTSRGCHPA